VLLYEPQQNKLSFEDISFLGGGFFSKMEKKEFKKTSQSPKCENK
jgi:hypothetical protein